MIIKIPKDRKKKRVSFSNAIKMAQEVRSSLGMLPEKNYPELFGEEGDTQDLVYDFVDALDLMQLYTRMMEQILDQMSREKIERQMSLLTYFVLYQADSREIGLYDETWIFRFLQYKYNWAIDFCRENVEKQLVDTPVWRVIRDNKRNLERLQVVADKFHDYKKRLKEGYESAIELKIDFWSFLDDLEKDKWELSEGSEIELISESKERIAVL